MNATAKMPVRGLDLFSDFDQLVNGLFNQSRVATNAPRALSPAIDIIETETGFEVVADVPGVDKNTLNVSVKDNVLTIEAGSDEVKEYDEGDRLVRSERRSGKYVRNLRLGDAINSDSISAEYVDGVLTVKVPKAEKPVARKIEVNAH